MDIQKSGPPRRRGRGSKGQWKAEKAYTVRCCHGPMDRPTMRERDAMHAPIGDPGLSWLPKQHAPPARSAGLGGGNLSRYKTGRGRYSTGRAIKISEPVTSDAVSSGLSSVPRPQPTAHSTQHTVVSRAEDTTQHSQYSAQNRVQSAAVLGFRHAIPRSRLVSLVTERMQTGKPKW